MTTIYAHKNHFQSNSANSSFIPKQHCKASHKLLVSPNIFANDYHIKEVHVISNGAILYETMRNSQRHIIHQVQINTQHPDQYWSLHKLISIAQRPHIDYVYFETSQLQAQNFIKLKYTQRLEKIHQLLEGDEKLKCQIVLNTSVGLEQSLNQNLLKQDFLSVLNQFLSFINFFNQEKDLLQDFLIFRNINTSTYVVHPFEIPNSTSYDKSHTVALQTIVKQYLLINVAKNLKDVLNIRSKPTQNIFTLYQAQYPNIQFAQFTSLLREAVQNKQKFTPKMLVCYIQILKQKYLKSKEEKQIFRHFTHHQSVHQPPQKDCLPERRQKQSNSFIDSHNQKAKSLSRKLKNNKQNEIIDNYHRRSDGPKSSSMVSMSPNRKNRKYMKCTTTSLFSGKKNTFERTSSTSFLLKTANGLNRNSSSSSFLDKNFYKTCASNTHSNLFKNTSLKNDIIPQSQIKSYLQTMGFKSKCSSDQIFETSKKGKQNEQIIHNPSSQTNEYIEPRILSQSSFGNQQNGGLISEANEKKLRIKQSLNLLERKSFQANHSTPENTLKIEGPQEEFFREHKDQRHESIIPESEKNQSTQKIPLSQGPISRTVIHKDRLTCQILYQKSMKFHICKLKEMNIKIKGTEKSKKLKLDRSTVMAMHLVNLEKRINTEQAAKSIQNERTSRESDIQQIAKEDLKERKTQKSATFKPSLASVKKQKAIQKAQKIQKPMANDSLSNHSFLQQKNQKPIHEQYPRNKSLNAQSQTRKNSIPSEKQFVQNDNLQTSYLTKSNTSGFYMNQSLSTSMAQQFQLSKQFFKQIFLYINSENKTLVDLLESKLSYQITFYAFYINYFKLNVTKTTTKQAIDKMWAQMKDYETKIKESQKINSEEKMLPEFEPFAKKLLNVNMESFVEKFWKKDELKPKEKENAEKISDQVDALSSGILKIAIKILQTKIGGLRRNQKQLLILIKGLKICATIGQLIYSVENKLVTLTTAELKKISRTALETQSGEQKKWFETIGGFQQLIGTYNGWAKQAETDSNMKINAKNENKKVQALLEGQ